MRSRRALHADARQQAAEDCATRAGRPGWQRKSACRQRRRRLARMGSRALTVCCCRSEMSSTPTFILPAHCNTPSSGRQVQAIDGMRPCGLLHCKGPMQNGRGTNYT